MAANPSIQLGTDGNWAIKEDNLLAYKKDGTRFFNKEFDFTRGSLATFIDKDGLIKVSGVTDTELVTNGTFDSDSGWNITGTWSISNGQASGSANSASQYIQQDFSITNGKKYLFYYEIIKNTLNGNGASLSSTGGFGSVPLSNKVGVHKIYIDAINSSAQYALKIGISGTATSGSVTLDNVSVKEIQTDVPRIDFTGDTTGHLLLEPQSTNLITYSEDFSQSVWTKNDVTVTSGFLAPDGTNTAYKVTESGSNAHLVGFSGQNTNKRKSIWARTVSGTGKVTLLNITTDTNALFDITEQWQRFEIAHSGADFFYAVDFRNTGATLSEVLIWGAQLEALPYATSYIPTSGSTVTRNAEVCNNSGSSQDFNSEEGVLYAEIAALANSSEYREISLNNGNTINAVEIRYTPTANNLQFVVRDNGFAKVAPTIILSNALEFNKIAFSYKTDDSKMYVNGIEVAIDTDCTMPNGLNRLSFDWAGNNYFYGKTKNLKVFKRAMSDDELYLLTVPQYQSYQEMATALNYTL